MSKESNFRAIMAYILQISFAASAFLTSEIRLLRVAARLVIDVIPVTAVVVTEYAAIVRSK